MLSGRDMTKNILASFTVQTSQYGNPSLQHFLIRANKKVKKVLCATRLDVLESIETKKPSFWDSAMAKVPSQPSKTKRRDYNRSFRRRRAFPITETELKVIAAAAMIGESKRPKNG